MATQNELIQKWDSFLQKIQQRFDESLVHAEEACMSQLVETDYDYYTVMRTWGGMRSQIDQLREKVDDTWDEKVEPEMRSMGDFWMDESFKANELTESMHNQMGRFQFLLEGKLSQKFYDHVMSVSNKEFNCTQCQASVEIKTDLFRSQYVTCEYCNTVNEFTPTTKFMEIGWNVVDNIAAMNSLEAYDKKNAANKNLKDYRPPAPDEAWDAYKQAFLNYYETYYKERIKLKSDAQERYEDDMNRKRKEYDDYEQTMRYNNLT